MGASLIIKSLCKSFGPLNVLDHWDLTVEKGERIVILGPSGAGKTSFLRIIAGLDTPGSGAIKVNSNRLGFVFQEPRLIPWRSVNDNLLFVNEAGNIPEILAKLRLKDFANYYPSQLSGGMQQRVNLARALLMEPDLLILDEAFTSLDLPVKISIMDDILLHWRENQFTMITVTHDLKEAVFLADRIIIVSAAPSRIIAEFRVELPKQLSFASPESLNLESQLLKILCEQANC